MPESPIFVTHLATRWGDQDAYGHVNNSRYFTYFEQARVDWLAAHRPGWQDADALPTVVRAACDYKRPVEHPATLRIALSVDPPGRTSLTTRYVVRLAGADAGGTGAQGTGALSGADDPGAEGPVCATGEVVLVWVRRATGRPVRLPADLRAALDA
jgi:acyl-CoA thioester hydrolase